jgi:methylase of polypeptide subunit release factors
MNESPSRSYHVDEGIVTEEDDWLDGMTEASRAGVLATLRALPMREIQHLPPPKEGSVPFGHELRVLSRFATGGNALFDPSGLWRVYRSLASEGQRRLYRAFILSDPLSEGEWADLIGVAELATWRTLGLLRAAESGLSCRFRVCPIGRVLLLGDAEVPKLKRRVVIGQDSFNMVHWMDQRPLERYGRYLDVGPGSGVVLLNYAHRSDHIVGIDINPRAVAISRLGAELNEIAHCEVHLDDAVANAARYGPFDMVTWNTPFVFMPEECRDTHLDAFGGHLGLELPLRFTRTLPDLLTETGVSYLGMSAPILRSGENALERELLPLARECGLDIDNHIFQTYWHALYREFHEAHDIVKNELVFLEIRRGTGRVRRVERPLVRRASDSVRELAYRIRH